VHGEFKRLHADILDYLDLPKTTENVDMIAGVYLVVNRLFQRKVTYGHGYIEYPYIGMAYRNRKRFRDGDKVKEDKADVHSDSDDGREG